MKSKMAIAFMISILLSCATTSDVEKEKVGVSYDIRAGAGWGGIIEDTQVDAVTGATNLGFTAGIHPAINIHGYVVETGIDVQTYSQSFTYNDPDAGFDGKRDFSLTELSIPLTYNFQFFNNSDLESIVQVRLGLTAGYIISDKITNNGTVPEYTLDNFSIGPTLGLTAIPFKLSDNMRLGFYFDLTRASEVYKDIYITEDSGDMSSLRLGLFVKFK